ncbi:MAG: DUF3048 domain-containing protein [Ilumatobacteraceae bacterium]
MTSSPTWSPGRRLAALALAGGLALAAAACSGDDDGADPATTGESVAGTAAGPAPTDGPATTAAPATTGAPVTTPAPPTTAAEVARMPLTGVPLASGEEAPVRPAMVVKIDNAPDARPQTGFTAADIVYEEIVNDSLTRFAMVFHSQDSDPVGPIRSGRIQDVDLFGSYHGPLFVWSGGNATVTRAIDDSDFVALDQGTPGMFRERSRRGPHNLYGSTSTFYENATPEEAAPPPAQFTYRDDGEAPLGVPSAGIDVQLDSIAAHWTWDAAAGGYVRETNGRPHLDAATGEQILAENVVVLEMEYASGISGSPDAQALGEGTAYVMTGGNLVVGTWTRADRLDPFTLTDENGAPIELTPGHTFIELPRPGNSRSF